MIFTNYVFDKAIKSLPFFTGMQRGSSKTRSGKVEHATFQCTDGKHAAKALKTNAGGIECGTETASRIINGAKVAAKVRIYKSNI